MTKPIPTVKTLLPMATPGRIATKTPWYRPLTKAIGSLVRSFWREA